MFIFDKNKFAKVLLLVIISSSCATYIFKRYKLKNIPIKSLVLTGYGAASYKAASVDTYLDELGQLNANTASFLFTCFTESKRSTNIDCQSSDSPTLQRISNAIEIAKKRKFLVNLRMYVDIRDGTWRCDWNPKNKSELFQNLNTQLTKIAEFSEKHKIEILTIGAEYCQLTKQKYTNYWIDIITNVRKVFKGKLTYGANWGKIHGSLEWQHIKFWKMLDFIGIDHYKPIPNGLTTKQITSIQSKAIAKYHRFANQIKLPLIISEFGFPGSKNGNLSPFEWRNSGKSSETKQAKYYRATYAAFKKFSSIKGVFIWRKLSQSANIMQKYNKNELGYELWQRKAWYELQKYFSSF